MSVVYYCQRPIKEEEEDEYYEADEEVEIPRTVLNRQVAKRRQFTLYEKMAAVQQIQQILSQRYEYSGCLQNCQSSPQAVPHLGKDTKS